MGLLQNISVLAAEPIRNMGGAGVMCIIRTSYNRPEQQMNMCIGSGSFTASSGYPTGYAPPYQWWLPIKDGGMSSFKQISGSGTVNSTSFLRNTKPCQSRITGSGQINNSALTMLIFILADLVASGTVTSSSHLTGNIKIAADLIGSGQLDIATNFVSNLLCDIAGSSSVTGSVTGIRSLSASVSGQGNVSEASLSLIVQILADLAGEGLLSANAGAIVKLSASLLGQGDVTSAANVIVWMISNLVGEGTLDGSILRGKAGLSAEITSQGELVTAKSCAQAVWDELLSEHQITGSAGKALTDAGSAGNPWSADPSVNNDPNTMGELVQNIKAKTDTITWDDIELIKNIESGRWKIENNQMIFYKPDNVTELFRFNLKDINGQPTNDAVTERVRV